MSTDEILAELPKLSAEEREGVRCRPAELDDQGLSAADELLVEERLAAHRAAPASAISLDEMKARLRSRFRA